MSALGLVVLCRTPGEADYPEQDEPTQWLRLPGRLEKREARGDPQALLEMIF